MKRMALAAIAAATLASGAISQACPAHDQQVRHTRVHSQAVAPGGGYYTGNYNYNPGNYNPNYYGYSGYSPYYQGNWSGNFDWQNNANMGGYGTWNGTSTGFNF